MFSEKQTVQKALPWDLLCSSVKIYTFENKWLLNKLAHFEGKMPDSACTAIMTDYNLELSQKRHLKQLPEVKISATLLFIRNGSYRLSSECDDVVNQLFSLLPCKW